MAAPRLLARAARSSAQASRLAAAGGPSRLFVRAESTAAAFQPALAPGADPAYDAALAYLDAENAATRKRLDAARAKAGSAPSPAAAARITQLEVDAEINDPATRRLFAQTGGKGSMDRAVMRVLAQRKWRREGELDLVMQRVFQLNVVPDLVPDLEPTAALRIAHAGGDAVEAGAVLPATAFAQPPAVSLQLFDHPVAPSPASATPEGLYTLLMIDPDAPNHETQSYAPRLHFAKVDIPVSVLSSEADLIAGPGNEVLAYEPPAPPKGSGKHRYVFVAIRQSGSEPEGSPLLDRDGFDLRAFLAARSLPIDAVVSATLFRSAWSADTAEHIAATYRTHRGTPAPEYGLPPKEMRYGHPLNSRQQRAETIRQEAWGNVLEEIAAFGRGEIPGDGGKAAA